MVKIPSPYKLRFRQVHLDFHTSPAIDPIGISFDKKQWQEALKIGHINSITCFAKCHHGWSYYDTAVGKRHPGLAFNLLQAQYDAAKEMDVNVPLYVSAGLDNVVFQAHPQWREIDVAGRYIGWTPSAAEAGFHKLCFNSPYLDYLCEQIQEVVALFPEADGVFLDIISQGPCCCKWCRALMAENDLNVSVASDRLQCAKWGLERYFSRTTAACKSLREDMPVFHNSGHIRRGHREFLKYFSHLELESLPTGGWGYDHFPLSAKYVKNLPHDFLGMTGKFHTNWGEFGGYKHPNALKYECSAMLAYGAKCSIGDQLHPSGRMDMSTCKLIGSAYEEVQAKEPWCGDVENVADIGLLSCEAVNVMDTVAMKDVSPDTGAARVLLEGHFLFDVIDGEMDFSKYKVLVLPDAVGIQDELKTKLDDYLRKGGKLFLTGRSGLSDDKKGLLFDIGADWQGPSEFELDYVLPSQDYRPSFVDSPLVMYLPSQRIKVTSGQSLGQVYDPYFNRTGRHFCSHQHAPARPEPSGFDGGVWNGPILYLAHPVFSIYRYLGAVAYQEYIIKALRRLLGDRTIEVHLPSTGRVTLMHQKSHHRYILHLLYANTISRGGAMESLPTSTLKDLRGVEVIEDLLPLYNITVAVQIAEKIKKVTCVPSGKELAFSKKGGQIEFVLPEFQCHQMIELAYA